MYLFLKLICSSRRIQCLALMKFLFFVVCVLRKGSLNEDSECGCLSHATTVASLEPTLWIV